MTTGDEIRRTRVAVLVIVGDAYGLLVITGRDAVIVIVGDAYGLLVITGRDAVIVIQRGALQHRVRPTPSLHELQIVINQGHPEPGHRLPGRPARTNQTWIGQRHPETFSSIDRQPQRLVEMS